MSSSNNNRKASKNKKMRKLSPEEETKLRRSEATTLRNYILQCTDVPSDCPAVRAALSGIDNEVKRLERDEKLRLKFAGGTTTTKTAGTATAATDDEDMEWQDVGDDVTDSPLKIEDRKGGNDHHHDGEEGDLAASVQLVPPEAPPTHDSPLGRNLASLSISSIAEAGITISHPLAAIAIVLHAAIVSDVVGFRCTGIPDEGGSKGFAKPIRELPRSVFVPDNWDFHASATGQGDPRVLLRYRKDGVGSVILRVTHQSNDIADDNNIKSSLVRVRFGPAGKNNDVQKGPPDFDIGDHVNLDGLAAALSRSSGGVPPALHYRALSTLLTDFCDAVDLGVIKEEGDGNEIPMEDANMTAAASPVGVPRSDVVIPPPVQNDPLRVGPPPVPVQPGLYDRQPRIEDFDTPVPNPGGDFAGDLAPGGIIDPCLGRPGSGVGGGNLMGPTHPSFRGGGANPNYYDDGGLDFDSNVPGGGPGIGGLGMRPRFDPVYPPGGPADPNGGGIGRGRGRGRGRGGSGRRNLGDPNPDHQRPPSDFGGDMFM